MSLILPKKMFKKLEILNMAFSDFYSKMDGAADLMKITEILLQLRLPKNLNKGN